MGVNLRITKGKFIQDSWGRRRMDLSKVFWWAMELQYWTNQMKNSMRAVKAKIISHTTIKRWRISTSLNLVGERNIPRCMNRMIILKIWNHVSTSCSKGYYSQWLKKVEISLMSNFRFRRRFITCRRRRHQERKKACKLIWSRGNWHQLESWKPRRALLRELQTI